MAHSAVHWFHKIFPAILRCWMIAYYLLRQRITFYQVCVVFLLAHSCEEYNTFHSLYPVDVLLEISNASGGYIHRY